MAPDHREGSGDISVYKWRLEDSGEKWSIRLEAIHCLAEHLESGPDAELNDVIATWRDNTLEPILISVEYPAVQPRQTERNVLNCYRTRFGDGPGLIHPVGHGAI
jgi:hypothetical protein